MSNYEFSLRQEVLLEKGADILGSLFHFARNNHISPSDKKDPVNVVYGLAYNTTHFIFLNAIIAGNAAMSTQIPIFPRAASVCP